jgi:hypothetical protein
MFVRHIAGPLTLSVLPKQRVLLWTTGVLVPLFPRLQVGIFLLGKPAPPLLVICLVPGRVDACSRNVANPAHMAREEHPVGECE